MFSRTYFMKTITPNTTAQTRYPYHRRCPRLTIRELRPHTLAPQGEYRTLSTIFRSRQSGDAHSRQFDSKRCSLSATREPPRASIAVTQAQSPQQSSPFQIGASTDFLLSTHRTSRSNTSFAAVGLAPLDQDLERRRLSIQLITTPLDHSLGTSRPPARLHRRAADPLDASSRAPSPERS